MVPNPQIIKEYIPKNGDEIIITFWDKEHRQELLVVEAELLPDEDREKVQVIVHPQGNSFEEPVKSAMSIWKDIKSTLKRAGGQEDSTTHHKPQKRETGRYHRGFYGMLEKIAYRDYHFKLDGRSSNWSYKWHGAIDNKTANSIDKDLGGKIKDQWNNPDVSGDMLVELLFEKYKAFEYLKAEWEELKKKEF
jgi:hypothetical protein